MLLAAAALPGCGDETRAVVVAAAAGDIVVDVAVDIAETADERRAGLRGVAPLDSDAGLWLEFPVEGEVCIVNSGVGFAIDAVYADERGQVVAIERAIGADDGTARCHALHRRVLEIAAGVGRDAATGDRLERR